MAEKSDIILYQTEDGQTKLAVSLRNGTVWLTQSQMAELFQRDRSVIAKHINHVFTTGELDANSVCAKNAQTGSDGKTYEVMAYNLDVIIAVGYRVNSHRGTQFRIWATQQLKEYIIKGFVLNDERLSYGQTNYFDELLERVRRIRASEKNFYDKVRDIFATSIDYDPRTDFAHQFYATVQNKFHYAITGHTAAELIAERVDSTKPHMGLTNWRGNIITAADAIVAKNYLGVLEIKRLELLVEQFLSFAELRSLEQRPMYMSDWQTKLDEFLKLNEKEILTNAGLISRREMEEKVRIELSKYNERISLDPDFTEAEFKKTLANVSRSTRVLSDATPS
jgi:hypothetical protein